MGDREEYIKSVLERMEDYSAAFIRDGDGNKKYPSDYSVENDVDLQKFIYFFRCVGFDEEICEKVLHPKANLIRASILETPLSHLMITSTK